MNELEKLNKQFFEQWKTLTDNHLSYSLLISPTFVFKDKYLRLCILEKKPIHG